MPGDGALAALQRRVVAALREPIGGASRARTDLPPRDVAASAAFVATANDLFTPSSALTAVERLELYHRQYWYRLLDSIAEDFPALRRALGRVGFWDLVEAYLEATPSRSFTLRHLGAGLADFVAAHPERVRHPVHAEDLARLEYALCLAFEAGARPAVAPERLGDLRLALQPHVQPLALRTAADTLWRRADAGRPRGRVAPPSPTPSRHVVVFRDDLVPTLERVHVGAYAILTAIAGTGSLDAAMARVAEAGVLPRRDAAARVTAWFQRWMRRGWLCEAEPDAAACDRRGPTL
ncbi:MAG: putative DNA-binding domain-containing protein [Kofleriaceae bacterium]|nr:putative DNA-binding domain-containing protein [Kofleriaceae bacterium]